MNISTPYATDYVSAQRTPPWWRRTFPGLSFYCAMFGVVVGAGRRAKRGRYGDAEWVESSRQVVLALEAIGARLTIDGLAGYTALDGPAVIIGNHMSTLETFVLPSILRPIRPVAYVVKRELVDMPVFKHVMRARQPIVVGRSSPREDLKIVLEEGEARLRAGISIVVFPQTTRVAAWVPSEFNSIGVKLAKRAGVPVVPLALRSDAWGIGRWVKDIGWIRPELPVRLAFGQPLTVTGNGRDAQEALVRFIDEHMRAWGVPVREAAALPAASAGQDGG
jgi:1-acyl-sn-glycerol-3-phosphate acyltransferase